MRRCLDQTLLTHFRQSPALLATSPHLKDSAVPIRVVAGIIESACCPLPTL